MALEHCGSGNPLKLSAGLPGCPSGTYKVLVLTLSICIDNYILIKYLKMRQLASFVLACGVAMGLCAQNEPFRDSSLPAAERAADLLSRLTLDEKVSLMMDNSPAIPRLDIPAYNWWNEALHGIGRAGVATVLPQSIGMAATFDDAAVNEAFTMVSDEARAKFNKFRKDGDIKRYQGLSFWTPNVNIFRDPRWGRGQETYGEDPYLAQTMGVAVVDGLQGDTSGKYIKTLAGAKHYAVHSGPEWNRHSFDAKDIDPRDLWETYLPAFKSLVDAGVWQVMCAYNRFEGEPCCSNKRLLQQILRNEWGFDKIIVSDCWAIRDFISDWAHNTHPSGAHASADAVISGTDLECGPIYKNLREAYDKGLITEETIDRSLVRLLEARFRLGEIDAAADVPWNTLDSTSVDTPEHRRIALDMARKSMTLLKNNGVLPLPMKGKKIIVAGPNAADSVMQWGNYNGFPSHTVTVLEGIKALVPDAEYVRGCDHVVSKNMVSHFDKFRGGMTASYWNGGEAKGTPAATVTYTSPIKLTTGGATVFAPGVDLTNFYGEYKGVFVPQEDGFYIIELDSSKGEEAIFVDGKEVARRLPGGRENHKCSYMFEGKKGKEYEIMLTYKHFTDVADLAFDVKSHSQEKADFSDADVVVFVGGISPQLEGEEMKVSVPGFRGGDRESIELPTVQRDLIKKIKDAGKQVVYVNCSGSAVALAQEDSICDAVLQAWYPGQAGGQAVAEVIFGLYNPAGRLPVTFYKNDAQLPDFEDYSMMNRTYRFFRDEPLYPFGHGLSYTEFAYGDAVLSAENPSVADSMTLTVPVTNAGKMDGDEVVQVYVRKIADPTGPIKTLRGYRRVNIPQGETVNVAFQLTPESFAAFDHVSGRMATLPGDYEILYGPSSANLKTLAVSLK